MGCVDELASGHSDRGHRDRQAALLQLMDVVMRDQRFLLLYHDVEAWIVRDENFEINILFTEADDISNRNDTFFLTENAHLFESPNTKQRRANAVSYDFPTATHYST